jgi:hypothetical protein
MSLIVSIGQTSSSMKTASRESIIAAEPAFDGVVLAPYHREGCLSSYGPQGAKSYGAEKISSAPSVDTAASRARYLI